MTAPLFTFAHATDAHLSATTDVLTHWVEALNAERFHPRPDYAILTGDIVQGGPDVELQLEQAGRILQGADMTVLPTPGNHDVHGDSPRGAAFRRQFGDDRLFYTRELGGGFLGVFMACAWEEDGRALNLLDGLDWLDAALAVAQGKRVLLFCHEPLLPPRKPVPPDKAGQLTGPPWGGSIPALKWQAHWFGWQPERSRPIRDRLARHGRVAAVYGGHAHVNALVRDGGVHHVVTAALCSTPWEYRYVRVFEDRIEHVCFSPVPAALHRHPVFWSGCTDEDHPTVESYHRGNEPERTFDIRLD